MSELAAPQPRRDAATSWLLMAAGFASLALSINGGDRAAMLAPIAAGGLFVGAFALRRPVIPWRHVLVALIVVILFIPIRRYRLPVDLSFELEPYRVLVALVLAGWGASLLVDPRVTLRRSGFERPIALILLVVLASILVNPGRVNALESTVVKAVTFLVSFILVLYLVVSVVRTQAAADVLAKTLVAGGAIVAVLAVVESRTGVTPFTQLDRVIPFLVPYPGGGTEDALMRGGTTRAFGSAEHPIALGAALIMLVPLAIHVVHVSARRVWYAALLALVLGSLTTVSRTGIIMLVVIGIVYLWLRPRETRRLWPLLVPLLVATHFVAPGTLGALKQSFFPEGGLIEQQRSSEGDCASAGRVADLGPTLGEASKRPFLGQGYGTRIPSGPDANACILDNQWLGTLLEVGLAGLIAWLYLFRSVVRKLGRPAKGDDSPAASLMVAATAAVTGYGVGMLTFDAFSFIQVTFLLFIILGMAAAVAANHRPGPVRRRGRVAKRRSPVLTRPVADAA
jgi:hypothetical protein